MLLRSYNKLSMYIQRHWSTLLPFITIYKIFNIACAALEMKIGRISCASSPFIYRIDPCSMCNLRCPTCGIDKVKTSKKRIMDLDDFKTIVDKIARPGLRASLYDMGEPLLNKNIYGMIKYANNKMLSTLISTNFTVFQEKDLDKLFDSKLSVLEPALDGFTQEIYEKYRIGGDVEKVKRNIKMVMKHKQRSKCKWPIVDVQIVLFKHLQHELHVINNFLKHCNVDRITYREEIVYSNQGSVTESNVPSNKPCFWLYLGMSI